MYKNNRWNIVTDEDLRDAVSSSLTMSSILRKINVSLSPSSVRILKRKMSELNIDTSHLLGKAWNKEGHHPKRFSASKILTKGSLRKRSLLMNALLEMNVPYACKECRIGPIWNGIPLTLQIDHIDGDAKNNEIANLRFLCPNCHTQTVTWGNKGNRKSTR